MDDALRILAARPARPGRFLLGPGLAGDRWLVGQGKVRLFEGDDLFEQLDDILLPGSVVVLGYETGAALLGARPGRQAPAGLPRAAAIQVEAAASIDPATGARAGDPELLRLDADLPALAPMESRVEASLDRAAHAAAVRRIHEAIRAGESYQTNLTVQFSAPFSQQPLALFRALHHTGPQACSAFVELPGDLAIASASPETLLRYDAATRRASSLPIKGTRPRGRDTAHDEALAAELVADPKERAEHVMIVDLVRNDLGRVAVTGSVHVPALMRVDRLPTVHHLVSEVAATLAPDRSLADLVRSLYPAGSITGAPKLRTMEIIEELEPVERGVYCGAIGYVAPDGSCALSVAIRTAVVHGGVARYGAGGGITIDADPDREWEELVLKARPFLSAVGDRRAW